MWKTAIAGNYVMLQAIGNRANQAVRQVTRATISRNARGKLSCSLPIDRWNGFSINRRKSFEKGSEELEIVSGVRACDKLDFDRGDDAIGIIKGYQFIGPG
jgi:hypothetical protein